MPSESRDPGTTVTLPPELREWLDRRAADLGLDRETVLVQLLSSYRAAEDLDGDVQAVGDASDLLDSDDIEPVVRDVLTDRLPDLTDAVADRVAADLREELTAEVRDAVAPDLQEDLAAEIQSEVETPEEDIAALHDRLDDVEADYRDKLDDVRQRVIQVKREADSKASAEDFAEALDRLDGLAEKLERIESDLASVERETDRIDTLQSDLDSVESEVTALRDEVDADRIDTIESDLEDAQDKLRTVAWVVRDLREAVQGGGASAQTLADIKRQAATEDISRATCENCGSGVQIGLLTEPSCPHCDATLDGVEPSKRRFGLGSPTLTVAAGLESGAAASGDELDDIDTTRRGDR